MKKTYFAPETVVVALSATTILADSQTVPVSEEEQDNASALSRRKSFNVWDDDEEE